MDDCLTGLSYPLGARVYEGGVNFSLYSKSAAAIELLFFDRAEDARPSRVIALDPRLNRTFHYWHIFVSGVVPGQRYGYRAHGPHEPSRGLRFDPEKLLLDPYGRAVAVPRRFSREAASFPGDNTGRAMKSVVVDPRIYDWEGDLTLERPFGQTVIYEMHVGGFTRDPSSGVSEEKRGTYAGLIEKIPYLSDLGVTAVELLPVFQFDEQDAPLGLTNYWGYTPVSFFAPHHGYSSTGDPIGALDEFRDMVKALHHAGIEVILDVVFNHTAEGNHDGPTYCLRGLENPVYYMLEQGGERYANYSGTGNTLNANQSIVRRLILDSLRYWVWEMHIDGFRFDLASILSRDEKGVPLKVPPILWDIETDPVLAGSKLIAEAWDAAGLYQVGAFFGDRWKEWNGEFRDDVRSFAKSDRGSAKNLPARILASPDIYEGEGREAEQSVNFVTCHDGFTMNDLVSYNEKRNEANGEGNRDGNSHNLSWNHGVEGPTDDPEIERLRNRQVKNLFTINLLALGVPMLSMGDEVRRTQDGNNNAYCQDSELSWFDWDLLEKHADVHRFVKHLIHFRQSLDVFKADHGLSLVELLHRSQIQWHGTKLYQPDWRPDSHCLAFTTRGRGEYFHVILNSYWEPLRFKLPPPAGGSGNGWRRVIDTYRHSPADICGRKDAPKVSATTYRVQPRSVVLLVAEDSGEGWVRVSGNARVNLLPETAADPFGDSEPAKPITPAADPEGAEAPGRPASPRSPGKAPPRSP